MLIIMKKMIIDKNDLSVEDVVAVARYGAPLSISHKAAERIQRSRALVEKWVQEGKIIYGITTGFGALSNTRISKEDTRQLQENIIMSHSAGVGNPLPEEVVRAIMAIRVHDLSMGYSGIRPETINHLLAFLNEGVCPVVPEKGSVGASGDLAPMSHLCLVLIGRGEAFYKGKRVPGKKALSSIGLSPITLEAGEGIALINGTQVMTAIATLVVQDAVRLLKMADIACAMWL